jgi:hypothetical protein
MAFTTLANAAGTTYSGTGNATIGFTMYRAPSGALVFATGSWRGWWSVSRWRGSAAANSGTVDVNWQNALLAVLFDLGQAPMTLRALQPGQDADVTDPSVGAPTGGRAAVARAYGLQVPNASTSFFAFIP